jgi:hypothetical protein
MKVRLNITLPEEVVREIEKRSGPRKRNHFIPRAVERHIETLRKEEVEALLEEGYKATGKNRLRSQKNSSRRTSRVGMNIRRGCVYLAALDPTVGNEISKTRPVIVVSNDKNNVYSTTARFYL